MEKNIAIIVEGAGQEDVTEIYDVKAYPGTTVREALEVAKLNGHHVRTESGDFLDPRDNLYVLVQDGSKLWAAADMDVG